jgi:rubrerythrin
MSGYNVGGFGGQAYMQTPSFQNAQVSEIAQGKQRAHEDVPAFDEAAFEQAFEQAHQDLMEIAEAEQVHTQPAQEALDLDRPGEMDPLLQRIRETRPGV